MRKRARQPIEDRFWRKVDKTGDCWVWTGSVTPRGYGTFFLIHPHVRTGAHQYSAMLHFGMFDRRLKVLHRCDNPPCVRPDHLFLGTMADNSKDMVSKGRHGRYNAFKTMCVNDHEFTEENTYLYEGRRMCRQCRRDRDKNRNRKKATLNA